MSRENVEVIGAVAPKGEGQNLPFERLLESKGVRGDAFWTYRSGKGKVFGTTTGHFTYTYYDPLYRLLLLRGIAWVMDEDPKVFMPLVFHGITSDEGFVGTDEVMMNYKNRKH